MSTTILMVESPRVPILDGSHVRAHENKNRVVKLVPPVFS